MGELIDGVWRRGGLESALVQGELCRPPSVFRNCIEPNGPFPPERGRYHLYVSLACPWAHRTLIMRSLKGLSEMISLSITHWIMGEDGWTFEPGLGVIPDHVNNAHYLHQLYTLSDPRCTSRVTVPVLWDKLTNQIVSNESADIIRMFNSAFDLLGATPGDYYPMSDRAEIDAVNERVYDTLNNGVYRAGFATEQAAYEKAAEQVFETLDWLELRLANTDFVVGRHLTEADIRLFTTLARFDLVYHGHFKCNQRQLVEYPALSRYVDSLYKIASFRSTLDVNHVKRHYYGSHPWLNPDKIVPIGPASRFQPTA